MVMHEWSDDKMPDYARKERRVGIDLLRDIPPPRSYFAGAGIALLLAAASVVWVAAAEPPHTTEAWATFAVSCFVATAGIVLLLRSLDRRRQYVLSVYGLGLDLRARLLHPDLEFLEGEQGDAHIAFIRRRLEHDLFQYHAALVAAGARREAQELNPIQGGGKGGQEASAPGGVEA